MNAESIFAKTFLEDTKISQDQLQELYQEAKKGFFDQKQIRDALFSVMYELVIKTKGEHKDLGSLSNLAGRLEDQSCFQPVGKITVMYILYFLMNIDRTKLRGSNSDLPHFYS